MQNGFVHGVGWMMGDGDAIVLVIHIMGCGCGVDASEQNSMEYMDFHENMSFCVRDAFGYKKQYINVS